ncbi:restriction modification system DNA specificity domain-containing protein [Stutzerimonas degradans]|nr:restriction modification system DNA specificity domain-containing protein [Stutzerimonas degradans]
MEWLGEVPNDWLVKRYKQVFSERGERSLDGSEELMSVSAYYGVKPRAETLDEGDHLSRAESLEGYKICRENDLVMNIMLAWNRGLGFAWQDGIVSPAYSVFHVIDGSTPKYLDYLVRSDEVIRYFKAYSAGVIDSRLRLYPETFGRLYVAIPPVAEQTQIARFLDHETARIDALIEEQQRLIDLLKEKRQAVISHAVTKGLDPTVPMKDSGVEWLGEVPAHWTVTKLKFMTDQVVDCPHETPIYDPDGDYLVIRTADIDQGVLKPEQMYRLDREQYIHRTRRMGLEKNDVVYSREGERWGHAALIPQDDLYALGQRMMQLRVCGSVCPEFFMYQLNSVTTYRQGEVDTVGATAPHVNISTVINYCLMRPPIAEQREISQYLSKTLGGLDCLLGESLEMKGLLQERRSALISAAVTGKIDVRGWQPPASTQAAETAVAEAV